MEKDINFVDAQDMHRKHPATFAVPYETELAAIAPGDSVKVCTGDERFWVEVTGVDGGEITGKVDNVLVFTDLHGLSLDDPIRFSRENVYDIVSHAAAA